MRMRVCAWVWCVLAVCGTTVCGMCTGVDVCECDECSCTEIPYGTNVSCTCSGTGDESTFNSRMTAGDMGNIKLPISTKSLSVHNCSTVNIFNTLIGLNMDLINITDAGVLLLVENVSGNSGLTISLVNVSMVKDIVVTGASNVVFENVKFEVSPVVHGSTPGNILFNNVTVEKITNDSVRFTGGVKQGVVKIVNSTVGMVESGAWFTESQKFSLTGSKIGTIHSAGMEIKANKFLIGSTVISKIKSHGLKIASNDIALTSNTFHELTPSSFEAISVASNSSSSATFSYNTVYSPYPHMLSKLRDGLDAVDNRFRCACDIAEILGDPVKTCFNETSACRSFLEGNSCHGTNSVSIFTFLNTTCFFTSHGSNSRPEIGTILTLGLLIFNFYLNKQQL